MEKKLNIANVEAAMQAKGLNQAGIANTLGVTRACVSQWLQARKTPRPDKLLRLGILLQLPFARLVQEVPDPQAPIVAFRKRSACKQDGGRISAAQRLGGLLKQLVPCLPFDKFVAPKTLKQPRCDYAYLQAVAKMVREMMGVALEERLEVRHLVKLFCDLQTVLVPVVWGTKGHYADGLQVYLPDSGTRWVYVNLDSCLWDFAFWMAHELGHCLAPSLADDEAERFADGFAQALLFPEPAARAACEELARLQSPQDRIARVVAIARDRVISPVTVAYATEAYAQAMGTDSPVKSGDRRLHAAITAEKKAVPTVSQVCLDDQGSRIAPAHYIRTATEVFASPFFSALKAFLLQNPQGASFIQAVLDVPILDAKAIYEELR